MFCKFSTNPWKVDNSSGKFSKIFWWEERVFFFTLNSRLDILERFLENFGVGIGFSISYYSFFTKYTPFLSYPSLVFLDTSAFRTSLTQLSKIYFFSVDSDAVGDPWNLTKFLALKHRLG